MPLVMLILCIDNESRVSKIQEHQVLESESLTVMAPMQSFSVLSMDFLIVLIN